MSVKEFRDSNLFSIVSKFEDVNLPLLNQSLNFFYLLFQEKDCAWDL